MKTSKITSAILAVCLIFSLAFGAQAENLETTDVSAQEQPETSEYTAADATPSPTPLTTVPTFDVATPTPMPISADDEDIATVLMQGLWKPLGSDGSLYYQFLPDGQLLVVQVANYTVTDGTLTSDVLNGEVLLGGNTVFTLQQEDGTKKGYVLNRNSNTVQEEEFVTPTPSPTPTASPTPSPTPTASPTPSPTPVPTPTLSPYEVAVATAPKLTALSDVEFSKRRSLDVYSAPDDSSYRDAKASVTTNSTVTIYGVVDDWVLVSYAIGYNNLKGRVGYIQNTTLANPDSVPALEFANVQLTLQEDASATDDPNYGQEELFVLNQGDTVTLLAFLGDDWAYVETTYQGKQCRVFIPKTALADAGSH